MSETINRDLLRFNCQIQPQSENIPIDFEYDLFHREKLITSPWICGQDF
jgi:hypothetical protein